MSEEIQKPEVFVEDLEPVLVGDIFDRSARDAETAKIFRDAKAELEPKITKEYTRITKEYINYRRYLTV